MKKYTYNDWWEGVITLQCTPREWDKGEDEPKVATWEQFSQSDVEKIKEKQKQIFEERVNQRVSILKEDILKKYGRSKMKKELLEEELQECANIMFAQIPNTEFVFLKYRKIIFDSSDLIKIQKYIDRSLKKGIDDGYDFIHSPNCKFQNKNKIPNQIYAQALWDYYNWLKSDFTIETDNKLIKADMRDDKKTNRIWFRVGLLFANGKMDNLIAKHKTGTMTNSTAIANELGNKNFRPYISESISGTNINDKNIFSNQEKISFIVKYCESNGIPIADSFMNRKK